LASGGNCPVFINDSNHWKYISATKNSSTKSPVGLVRICNSLRRLATSSDFVRSNSFRRAPRSRYWPKNVRMLETKAPTAAEVRTVSQVFTGRILQRTRRASEVVPHGGFPQASAPKKTACAAWLTWAIKQSARAGRLFTSREVVRPSPRSRPLKVTMNGKNRLVQNGDRTLTLESEKLTWADVAEKDC